MKSIKILILFSLLILINFNIFAFSEISNAELYIINKLENTNLFIKLYPISAIFTGHENSIYNTYYSLSTISNSDITRKGNSPPGPILKYLVGLDKFAIENRGPDGSDCFEIDPDPEEDTPGFWLEIGHDNSPNNNLDGIIGYGIYKLEIYKRDEDPGYFTSICQPITLDFFDFNYTHTGWNGCNDLWIRINSIDSLNITFQWKAPSGTAINGDELSLFSSSPPVNGNLRVYNQYWKVQNNQWLGYFSTPNKGISLAEDNFLIYPIDGRSLPSSYTILQHINPGNLRGNVIIDTNISTRDTLIDNPTNIILTNQTDMIINSGNTFSMTTPISPSNGTNHFIIDTLSRLFLYSNAKIYINNRNILTLKKNSSVKLFSGSEIRIRQGGLLCNEGADILGGNGKIIYESGHHYINCYSTPDCLFKDSVKVILDSNAILEIPDSTTLHFTGNTTSLILKPNSKLKFGQNSKILIDSGAKLIANNAEFSSVDSTKKWIGINLLGNSQDTIKNCTIKNAEYGVSIANKNGESDSGVSYTTEISGCTFVNQSNSALNSGIYVYNSNNVLLMNNTITSGSSPSGLVFGIYAEYCPAGNFNIIGNSINNSDKGIAVIQCSPYIARNTLNGNSTCESGILLDNSNGTIEYNTVSDFFYSYYTYYSSPNLLKNTFNNSFEDNLYLSSYSAPVMHPLSSESIINYFAGGNLITGSPSNSGIYFYDESFPDMDNGFNSLTLSNSTYYINGDIPSGMSGILFAEKNYWGETPQSSKFGVSGGTVDYSPYESSDPTNFDADYSDLYDIGFGLYDSVLVKDNSDNPSPAEDIYLLAFQKEYSKQYSQAIELYNEIVTDYRDSVFAASSMSRLFNCYEKKISSYTEFNSLETFYRNIFNDSSYTELLKNISQEFMIKSKVKNNKIQEAIDDYDSIYIQNTNTPKGTHALINKEILISISMSTSNDNSVYNSELENMITRQQRIVEILSNMRHDRENILMKINSPVSYGLSQNYPNPFNPSTVISYQQ